jgi:hypothetical protein
MKKGLIYLLGVVLLGLAYGGLKNSLGGPTFTFVAITYLVILRFFAEKFGR